MKNLFILLLISVSSAAYAGKEERARKVEIKSTLKTHAATFKKACGCDVKFDIKWDTYAKVEHMTRIEMAGEKLAENAPTFCTDAESKKAICVMKTMALSYGAEPADPQLKGSTIVGQTNDMRTLDWGEYIKLLDK